MQDEAAAAQAFVRHVRETYRAEPEVRTQIRGEGDSAEWARSVEHDAKTREGRAAETWRDLCLSLFSEETVPESKTDASPA